MCRWLFLVLCVAGMTNICFTARPCLSLLQLNYTSLGCWKDSAVRAVPSKEGDPILGSSNYTQRVNAIQQCAQVAFNHSFQVFVVQNGGWCGTSANASSTYKKYGPSSLCAANGKGGRWANNVYKLSPLDFIGCYIDQEPRDLGQAYWSDVSMTSSVCIAHCSANRYKYAGTQFHDQCYCGNSYGSYGEAGHSECNTPCRGDSNEMCGGTWRNSVYKTGFITCLTKKGQPCHLPFIFNNVTYASCTTDQNKNTSWCSLTANYDTDQKWGNCLASCQGTKGCATEGPRCYFPFTYQGKNYSKCIKNNNGNTEWCSLTANYDSDKRWGNCVSNCAGSTACQTYGRACVFPFIYGSKSYNSCTAVGNGGRQWCSLTANYDTNGLRGNCSTSCPVHRNLSQAVNQTTAKSMLSTQSIASPTQSPTNKIIQTTTTTSMPSTQTIATTTKSATHEIYCNGTSLPVTRRNASYTFPRTKAGLTSVSFEKCQNGNPIASVDCIISSVQQNKATFGVPFVIDCSTTLATVALQINSSNATTAVVQNTVATLKLLTSNASAMTSTHITQAVTTLSSLSQTNSQTVNITINTMYDALVTADHISASYRQASNVSMSSSTTANQQEKQSVVKAISAFADRVIFPPNSTNIKLTTTQITLQVTEPTTINAKHAAVTFGSSGNVSDQPVAVFIPGSLFDEAHSTLYSRSKRATATSASPIRASVVVYYNNTLFPAAQNPPVVLSVHILGYQPSTTTTGIQLNFTNTKAKQGSVPFKNGSLKETVTRTQCNVYQASDGSWRPNGCTLVMGSSPPRCSCRKLASFSMIVSTKVFPSAFAQGIVSYVGCSLSIIGLVITLWVYLAVTELRRRQPTKFLLNICFNLLIVNLIFVFGAANLENSTGCYVSTALMHFFLLATWFWMSANAYNMYKALTDMMRIGETSSVIPAVFCYLVPFLVVVSNSMLAVFYVDQNNRVPDDPFFQSAYRARNMCWLYLYSLNFGFLLPVGILALFNTICFILVIIKIMCRKSQIRSTVQKRKKRDDFLIAISVCVVMGLTWLFGFMMMIADNVIYQTVMSWLFTIFNSTQGLFIFLMNCVRQKKVRDMWWLPIIACVTCKQQRQNDRGSSVSYTQ